MIIDGAGDGTWESISGNLVLPSLADEIVVALADLERYIDAMPEVE